MPIPVLSGSVATYPDVKPGIDLVVTPTAAGVEQDIVIRNATGLANLGKLALPVTAKAEASYAATAGGGAIIKDKSGRVIANVPGMQMWDGAVDPTTKRPVPRALGASFGKLVAKAGRSPGLNIQLNPDLTWLHSPSRVFPITLDPTINPEATTFDTYVSQGTSADESGENDLQFGTTSGNVTRAFLSWDMTSMEHATINSATVYFYAFYSASCTPAQWNTYYDATAATASTTWSNQPAATTAEGVSNSTKGFSSSCDDGWISVDGKGFFQAAANAGGSRGYMQIRANDEGLSSIGFKQVRSRNASDPAQVPYAVVTYSTVPVIGARSTTPATACATGASTPYINTKTPTLKAVVSQGNGATSTVNFEWWATGGARIGTSSSTGVASGNTATAVVPSGAFAENGNYEWHVDASGAGGTSAWSSYCAFIVDTTAPTVAPTVSSSTYPVNQWAGSGNTPGTFTFGASGVADVNSYLYGLDDPTPSTSVGAAALGGSGSASITPGTSGQHILYVQSVDRAGNKSPIASYTFYVGGAAVTSPTTGSSSAGTTVLAGQAPSTTTGVTYQWRRSTPTAGSTSRSTTSHCRPAGRRAHGRWHRPQGSTRTSTGTSSRPSPTRTRRRISRAAGR